MKILNHCLLHLYGNVESLCSVPEANIILYVTYTSINKETLDLLYIKKIKKELNIIIIVKVYKNGNLWAHWTDYFIVLCLHI